MAVKVNAIENQCVLSWISSLFGNPKKKIFLFCAFSHLAYLCIRQASPRQLQASLVALGSHCLC
ncbi:MAG: hypothetical protein ACLRV7_07750, partial [Hoylesella buccalis]